MALRRSRYIHQLPVGDGRIVIIHAVNATRLPADKEVNALLDYFAEPHELDEACAALATRIPYTPDALRRAIAGLVERGVLTAQSPEEEQASLTAQLTVTHGRDPVEMVEHYRRAHKSGVGDYWSVGAAHSIDELGADAKRVDALLFGDCDIQMESDFLRREAAKRGIDLRIAATFPDDARFAGDHHHDVIFIGALRARHHIITAPPPDQAPHAPYIMQAHHLVTALREHTSAPILIDNLPEPTVQPLGMAEHGLGGHRARFRMANISLTEWAATMDGVYVVDIAAALAAAGNENRLDDGLVDFTHFGSPGWMLQRLPRERAAVHDNFPDTAPLVESVGGDPYIRENTLAATHIDAMMVVLGIDRKKCVILDLDGTLWPGVLAETGAPFAWTPEISGQFSYIGLYFGLHEALLCLKKRGIVLACVSKNDEATVRDLWRYPAHYPQHRLLTPDDFVTWRVNWNDKVDNIQSIADELGFALDTFLFIDDHPIERDRVRRRLPAVEVWGENPFTLRRRLLNDPRLQLPRLSAEAAQRSALVKSQLQRQHLRADIMNEADYIASLNISCRMEKCSGDGARLARIEELFQRTTQFNTTGRKFSATELARLDVYSLDVSDRFGAHGLVGAAVIDEDEILGVAISCRVLGMGVEHQFMRYLLSERRKTAPLRARLIKTARNIPARNIFRDHGFVEHEPGLWVLVPLTDQKEAIAPQ